MPSNLATYPDPMIDKLCAEVVHAAVAPDVAAAYAIWDGQRWKAGVGGSLKLFDLASLTKSFVAVAAALSGLPMSTRLGDVLPALAHSASASVSLEALLAHRSGLKAHEKLWLCSSKAAGLRRAADSREKNWDGVHAIYSDLGYILAGEMLCANERKPLARVVSELVCAPLDIGVCAAELLAGNDVAPTEFLPGRGGLLCGQVHDDNAWFLSKKGISGHAGLFGTAADVLRFGAAVADSLRGAGPFAGALDELLRRRDGGVMRAGFDGKAGPASLAGARSGEETFGHLGFTGTSYWVDPVAGIVTVLLTNRVSPSSAPTAGIRTWRPKVHDALFDQALRALRTSSE